MNPQSFSHAWESFFAWTWRTSLEATVLILLVFLAQAAFGKLLSVRWRYALSLLILLRLVIPFVPASSFSIFNLGRLFPTAHPTTQTALSTPSESAPITLPQHEVSAVKSEPKYRTSMASSARNLWVLGCTGFLFMVVRQHRKISRWAKSQRPVTDPATASLLEDCRGLLKIRREVKIINTPHLHTPAVFGWRKPCLLLPEGMLGQLSEPELRLVFLHELIHIRRGDVLLNWIIILVRSLHWFNPFVWLALRRLRTDQELVCDAHVLGYLAGSERRLYGHTLLKLLTDYSAPRLCPSLVPFITHKNIIQRRITMISQFKSTSRLALTGSFALLLLLGLFTFTRAAEKPAPVPPSSPTAEPPSSARANADQDQAEARKAVEALQEQVAMYDQKVRRLEDELDRLRRELQIPSSVTQGGAISPVDVKTVQQYEALRVDAEGQNIKEEVLLKQLRSLNHEQLLQALSIAFPDPIMNSLMADLNKTQTKLAGLRESFGKDHPNVVQAVAAETALKQKLDERARGIFAGMEARIASLKAVAANSTDKLNAARKEDFEAQSNYQPYFQKKAELEQLKKFRDILALRAAQEKVDLELPKSIRSK